MNLQSINGLNLTPLFHSEITSSYLLKEVLSSGNIAKRFIQHFLNVEATVIQRDVNREKWFEGSGSIDLYIKFTDNQKKNCVLIIEVKVHDYLSATKGQLDRYYKAVMENDHFDDIYIVYLTQFNVRNFTLSIDNNITKPPTLTEFADFAKNHLNNEKFFHLTWNEFHEFLVSETNQLTTELILMVDLQKLWINAQMETDMQKNTNKEGTRSFNELFGGLEINVDFLQGQIISIEKRQTVEINLKNLEEDGLNRVFTFIVEATHAPTLLRKQNFKTEQETEKAVCNFLKGLADDIDTFRLLAFYAQLFNYVIKTDHLLLNGTGNRGFSIIANHESIPRLSVCTLLKSHKVVFGLVR
jgi:hypothetical protein